MESGKFSEVLASLDRLVGAEISDLSVITSNIQLNGLPLDWIDDVVNLTAEQKITLQDRLVGVGYQWTESLHQLLGE